jgi:hypothetical protein
MPAQYHVCALGIGNDQIGNTFGRTRNTGYCTRRERWRSDQHDRLRGRGTVGGPASRPGRQDRRRSSVSLRHRGVDRGSPQDESAFLEKLGTPDRWKDRALRGGNAIVSKESEDQVQVGGPIELRDMSSDRLLVIADVLAKSVELAHDEREVTRYLRSSSPSRKSLRIMDALCGAERQC